MKQPKIDIDATSLEDLIVLGDDKLINILIEFPTVNGEKETAKAKIKQLTMKELKNLDFEHITLETIIGILNKALFTQDGSPFPRELILELPIGVVKEVAAKILEVSGADVDLKGF